MSPRALTDKRFRDLLFAFRLPLAMVVLELTGVIIALVTGFWPIAMLCLVALFPTLPLFFSFDQPFCKPRYTHMFHFQDIQRVADYLKENRPVAFIENKRAAYFLKGNALVPLRFIFEDQYVKAKLYL